MKRLVVVLAAAVAAFAVYTVTAPAGPKAVSPKRVARLEKKVSKVKKDLNALKRCLYSAVPVTQYTGYQYMPPGATEPVSTTALDLTEEGGQIGAILIGTRPDCVSALRLRTVAPARRAADRK